MPSPSPGWCSVRLSGRGLHRVIVMSKRYLLLTVLSVSIALAIGGTPIPNAGPGVPFGREPFSFRQVASGLDYPWEITWGPDGYLWVTERAGKRVTRVHPSDGTRATAVIVGEAAPTGGQEGLLGMALHPELLRGQGNDFVYVVYTYDPGRDPGVRRRTKIRRYTYHAGPGTLDEPVDLLTNLPAHNDHNSGRLVFGPDRKLYGSIGDLGSNQFDNKCNPIRAQELPTADEVSAQDWAKYQGKIIRVNLDGSIPSDNPLLAGVRSHIYSYGHRNAQGLAFGPDGKLYASEHGPKSDDELNLIRPGKNYGWPHVAGFQDDQAYVYADWSSSTPIPCTALQFSDYVIPPSVPSKQESEWQHPDFAPPIKTFFTMAEGFNFQDPAHAPQYVLGWPTVGACGIDLYTSRSNGIPGWANSILMTSLKRSIVYRSRLSSDGASVQGEPLAYFPTRNRYRDLALGPDHRTIYLCTDNEGITSFPARTLNEPLANPGAIIEFKYLGN